MEKITPFLWFDKEAEEAARFYCSIFRDGKMGRITRYGDAGPGPKGQVMTVEFQAAGQRFIALNGGPHFKFNEAVSFSIETTTQEDTDLYWRKLIADGGQEGNCGWLKDKFGLSWQVNPKILSELIADPDAAKSKRVMNAMLKMKKIDIAELERTARG